MRRRVFQTRQDLARHLDEQLGFVERSAEAFDSGYQDEAKRLAVTIRLLVHDTAFSHSLLSQLDRQNIDFVDSAIDVDPNSLIPHAGLAGLAVGAKGVRYEARLDGDDPSWFRRVGFSEWWNRIVITDNKGLDVTRKDLVLAVANQDGGAHVDPALDEDYARLSRNNALGEYFVPDTGKRALENVELISIRQIAHEVLKTLKPGYAKTSPSRSDVIIGSVTVQFRPTKGG